MVLSSRVRRRREELGLTQQDLADRTGIQQTLISRIERGANMNPKADALLRLARALHCSIDYLVGLYEEEPDRPRRTPAGTTP